MAGVDKDSILQNGAGGVGDAAEKAFNGARTAVENCPVTKHLTALAEALILSNGTPDTNVYTAMEFQNGLGGHKPLPTSANLSNAPGTSPSKPARGQ